MRGKQATKRKILADPKFNSLVIAKLINHIMERGKKTIAQKIVYGAFDIIRQKTKQDPLEVFEQALKNVTPEVEIKSKRIGGANYQIPFPVLRERGLALSFRWLIQAARSKKGKPMKEKLAEELMEAFNKQGAAIKKKEDIYRMAQANRAFAHFAR
ncbi:MAG: small subunit ribosomal protein S7 [Parcubacteria group bacterium Athens1014_10]|nr:MAG: small subunit ribosomal protein S7 [Parcubacteria group bacterium Athens1014_10]TSD05504.1 MAG: small subunit ribosomal protein S7 [Parcubacteria group bacterium Athens0714_12]